MSDLDRDERRRQMAAELRESGERMTAIMQDSDLSRAEKERRLGEITGEGAFTYAVMIGELDGDDV